MVMGPIDGFGNESVELIKTYATRKRPEKVCAPCSKKDTPDSRMRVCSRCEEKFLIVVGMPKKQKHWALHKLHCKEQGSITLDRPT